MQYTEAVEHEGELWYPWSVFWKVGEKEYSTSIFARSHTDAVKIVKAMRESLEVGMEILGTEEYKYSVTKH